MEFPHLFRSKRTSHRPRPPDDEVFAPLVRHRFSRAIGLLVGARRALAEREPFISYELSSYQDDCLQEVIDLFASDAYRPFFERDLGTRFRLRLAPSPTLFATTDEDLPKLESELLSRYNHRAIEHAFSFGIGALMTGIGKYGRRADPSWVYEPPLSDESPELQGLRCIMADFAARETFQRRAELRLGFLTPNRVLFTRGMRLDPPTLEDQVKLERLQP
jgi:hypothetical protein